MQKLVGKICEGTISYVGRTCVQSGNTCCFLVDEVQPQPSSRMTSGKISDCGNHGHIGLEPVVMQEVHYIGTHYQIFHPKQLFIGEEDVSNK